MKKSFSDSLIVLVAFVALLLVILLGWQSWNHARLKIEIAFAEEQTKIFDSMREKAIQADARGAAGFLEYAVNYYPSGSKQRSGSRLDKILERMRSYAVRDIISHLRQKTGEDLGEKPKAWIEKYAKNN